jgi:hypothetical protein
MESRSSASDPLQVPLLIAIGAPKLLPLSAMDAAAVHPSLRRAGRIHRRTACWQLPFLLLPWARPRRRRRTWPGWRTWPGGRRRPRLIRRLRNKPTCPGGRRRLSGGLLRDLLAHAVQVIEQIADLVGCIRHCGPFHALLALTGHVRRVGPVRREVHVPVG